MSSNGRGASNQQINFSTKPPHAAAMSKSSGSQLQPSRPAPSCMSSSCARTTDQRTLIDFSCSSRSGATSCHKRKEVRCVLRHVIVQSHAQRPSRSGAPSARTRGKIGKNLRRAHGRRPGLVTRLNPHPAALVLRPVLRRSCRRRVDRGPRSSYCRGDKPARHSTPGTGRHCCVQKGLGRCCERGASGEDAASG